MLLPGRDATLMKVGVLQGVVGGVVFNMYAALMKGVRRYCSVYCKMMYVIP